MKIKNTLVLSFFSTIMCSQEIESIQADRPDQTETPTLVPTEMFQLETGFTFQKDNENSSALSLPSTLWKYGVNENFEIRLITEFVFEEIENEKINGIAPIYLGFKTKLAEEKGIIPKTSFIAHISLPNAASTNFKMDYFAPEFRFAMQHTVSEKFSLSYNLGAEWDGFSAEPTFIYTLATGYSITQKLGSYIELFGFMPQSQKSNHNFDGGITYLINKNFMLDLSSGFGVTDNAPKHFIAFGFSVRH